MIRAIQGMPGSGKSYVCVVRAIDYWRFGGTVAITSNFGLKWDRVKKLVEKRHGVRLEDSQFVEIPYDAQDGYKKVRNFFKHIPHGSFDCPVYVILDEVHEFFNARDWSQIHKECRETLSFLTHHRHYHVDIDFVSQRSDNVDAQFRRLASQDIWMRAVGQGVPGIFPVIKLARQMKLDGILGLDGFIEVVRDYNGNPLSTFPRRIKPDPEIFDLYESFIDVPQIERRGQVKRLTLKKKSKKKMWRFFFIAAILIVGVILFGFKSFSKVVGPEKQSRVEPGSARFDVSGKQPEKQSISVDPGDPRKKEPKFQIVQVKYRGMIKTRTGVKLFSDQGNFSQGSMSLLGYVQGIDPENLVVKVRDEFGQLKYVILTDEKTQQDSEKEETQLNTQL